MRTVLHHTVDPHLWFKFLWDEFRDEFVLRLGATRQKLNAFWSGCHPSDPRWADIAHLDRDKLWNWGIPFRIHGDGIPCNGETLNSVQWCSLICEGSTVDTHFLSFCYFQSTSYEDETKDSLWQRFVDSLRIAETGLNTDGTPLAGGFFLAPWMSTGDEDWDINHLKMPGHWNQNHPCRACRADRNPNSKHCWTYFRSDASWMSTTFLDPAEWRNWAALCERPLNPLFRPRDRGGLGLGPYFVWHDRLHTVDLTICAHVNGHVLWHFAYTDLMNGSPEDNLSEIVTEIKSEYRDRRTTTQFGNIFLGMVIDPEKPNSDFPVLRGKAAEQRHLLPILCSIWRKRYRRNNQYEAHIMRILENLEIFYDTLDSKDDHGTILAHLPESSVHNLRVAIDLILTHVDAARAIATAPGLNMMLWPIVPKYHKLWHIGFESQFGNPRLAMTFGGEDFVRIMKGIATASYHGTPLINRSKSIVDNYCLGMVLKMLRTRPVQ